MRARFMTLGYGTMKQGAIIALVLLLLALPAGAAVTAPPVERMNQTYGTAGDDEFTDAASLSPSQAYKVAYTGYERQYLQGWDPYGTVTQHDPAGVDRETLTTVVEPAAIAGIVYPPDEVGYVIVGSGTYTPPYGEEHRIGAMARIFDIETLEPRWEIGYYRENRDCYLMDVVQSWVDGRYTAVGGTITGDGNADIWFLKVGIGPGGGGIWREHTYGSPSALEFAYALKETFTSGNPDGFILAGIYRAGGWAYYDPVLVRTDEEGTLLWEKKYTLPGTYWIDDIVQTADGNYLLAGATATELGSGNTGPRDLLLLKVNSQTQGGIIWQKTYGGGEDDVGYHLYLEPDGSILVVGSTRSYGAGGSDVWLLKVDASGNTIWSTTFGGPGDDAGYSIAKDYDGYALVGYTESFSRFGGRDAWVIRTTKEQVLNILPLPGSGKPPTDPDHDGIFEDTNGNGMMDYDDAVVLFWNVDWVSQNEPVSAFDFNGNGIMDYDDAVTLFWQI